MAAVPGPARRILFVSLLLAFTAGFADAATFIAADELFSAHVTGNFIVFAYDVVKHTDFSEWSRLLAFPVFIVSVMAGGRLARKTGNAQSLLLAEGILLVVAAAAALGLRLAGAESHMAVTGVALLIVFAIALQNAFGRLDAKATLGPTTVMTGNVTQATLDFVQAFLVRNPDAARAGSFRRQGAVIALLLVGCLFGAFGAQALGLCVVALPGVLLTLCFSAFQRYIFVNENN